ncbi:MAG: hypothetical protein KF902_06260 [Phycisphaeraceae bacterium]|nr:hypothetical protein [Phycisphaeraceae bacterium]
MSERFIFGQTSRGRPYVVHRHHPRFVAQIMADADAPDEGRVVRLDDRGLVIANFAWVDEIDGLDIEPVLRAMANAACCSGIGGNQPM